MQYLMQESKTNATVGLYHGIFDYPTGTYIKEEMFNGMLVDVVEFTPLLSDVPYSKMNVRVSRDSSMIITIECFDHREKHIKTLERSDFVELSGIRLSKQIKMTNHKNNHTTILSLENITINSGLDDSIFTIQNLSQ